MNTIVLNPNCSEAVVRIDVTKLPGCLAENLFEELKKEVDNYDYNTTIYWTTIFGKEIIQISGDMPYNHGDILEEKIKKHDLAYEFADPY